MTASAGASLMHKLECLTCEGGLACFAGAHTEHKLEELCALFSFFSVLVIDTHMSEFKTEHLLNSILCKSGDLIPLLISYEVILNHEGAAASNNLVEFEVVEKIFSIDAACGHECKLTVRSSHSLKHFKTACSLCGEELNCGKSKLESRLYIRGVRATGKHRNAL